MISARLIKELEKIGFKLDFPSYETNGDIIFEILDENNPRLNLALPLLLRHQFDYAKIVDKLKNNLENKHIIDYFNKIIAISNDIFKEEGINNDFILSIIGKNKIKSSYTEEEYLYFYSSFIESGKEAEDISEESLAKQLKIRSSLNTNKALEMIFSPAKISIINKIFSHDALTNTELKYYYKAIRPISRAILNDNLQKYLLITESNKKYTASNIRVKNV